MTLRIKQNPVAVVGRTPRDAVAAVLVCAVWSDGSVQPVEMSRLEQAMRSMRMFGDCREQELRALVRNLFAEVARDGAIAVSRTAAVFVPNELRLKAFGLATDLVFSDRRQRSSERVFLESLRRALGINRVVADRVVQTMTTRYCV